MQRSAPASSLVLSSFQRRPGCVHLIHDNTPLPLPPSGAPPPPPPPPPPRRDRISTGPVPIAPEAKETGSLSSNATNSVGGVRRTDTPVTTTRPQLSDEDRRLLDNMSCPPSCEPLKTGGARARRQLRIMSLAESFAMGTVTSRCLFFPHCSGPWTATGITPRPRSAAARASRQMSECWLSLLAHPACASFCLIALLTSP